MSKVMQPASPATPAQLIYAIGDIHGRADLLETALTDIADHASGRPARIIVLGDMIDRGPHSREVIERLKDFQDRDLAICLKGNHEASLLTALSDTSHGALGQWRDWGGRETLRSYGADAEDDPASAIPRAHLNWLAGLPLTTADDYRLYVHAGVAPGVPFERQTEATLLWIREPFLRAKAKAFEMHIVHAHTPHWAGKQDPAKPELLPHRTNLDTLAYASGVLTVGVFDPKRPGGPITVLTARGEPSSITPSR